LPKFAANLGLLWPDRPLLERMEAAARSGFRAVEFHFPYATPAIELARCARALGLTVLGINAPPGDVTQGEFGLAALADRKRDFDASLDQAVEYASECGAPQIHVLAGNVPPPKRADARRVLIDNLGQAAARAASRGLVVLIEPLNHHDRPQYFYATVAEAESIIEAVGAPNLKLQFDCYHVGRSVDQGVQDFVLRELERVRAMVGHVQIAGVPSRAEPDEGLLDYGRVLSWLQTLGYQGWIGAEYQPRADTDAGLRWLRQWAA